eukprot:3474247-Pleurochrysis_carterae.AAC.1
MTHGLFEASGGLNCICDEVERMVLGVGVLLRHTISTNRDPWSLDWQKAGKVPKNGKAGGERGGECSKPSFGGLFCRSARTRGLCSWAYVTNLDRKDYRLPTDFIGELVEKEDEETSEHMNRPESSLLNGLARLYHQRDSRARGASDG